MRRSSRIDAVVEVPADDTRDARQQRYAIEQALRAAGFTINDLVLYSRDNQGEPARGEAVEAMREAVRDVEDAAEGGSNDAEIEALQQALDLALTRWPGIDR